MTALQLATVAAPDDEADDAPAAVAASPAPPPVRRRNRPPQGGTPASGSPSPTTGPSDDTPTEIRLRMAWEMRLEGRTVVEIARHFGKCERTIRSWLTTARTKQAHAFNKRSAAEHAADIETKYAKSYAIHLQALNVARLAGDYLAMSKIASRMDAHTSGHASFLLRAGVFDRANFAPPSSGGPGEIPDSVTRSQPGLALMKIMANDMLSALSPHRGDTEVDYDQAWTDINAEVDVDPVF